MPNRDALLLSIRPKFAEQIFAGKKNVELRRVRPKVEAGDLVIVYASGETKALLGAFEVARVVVSTPEDVWRQYGQTTGLCKAEFEKYYSGSKTAYAIEVAHAWRLAVPVCLQVLRKRRRGFRPPQGYHYLDAAAIIDIGGPTLLSNRKPENLLPARRKLASRNKPLPKEKIS